MNHLHWYLWMRFTYGYIQIRLYQDFWYIYNLRIVKPISKIPRRSIFDGKKICLFETTIVYLENAWALFAMITEGEVAIMLETTQRAFHNQSQSKQRSTLVQLKKKKTVITWYIAKNLIVYLGGKPLYILIQMAELSLLIEQMQFQMESKHNP